MYKVLLFVMFCVTLTYSQTAIQPTELEQAKLSKLKAQYETFQVQLSQIDTQIQALNILKQLTQEHQRAKNAEFIGLSEDVKKAHKDWGDISKVNFDPTKGDGGTFTKLPEDNKPVPPVVPVSPSQKK